MGQTILERQSHLPVSIPLLRYTPERAHFNWESWDPSKVRTAADLPPYLVLGKLDQKSFELSATGWSAAWRGIDADTHFDIEYVAEKPRCKIRQIWRGAEGGFSTYPSKIPLEKLISSLYIRFPSNWDKEAKSDLERRFQITYIEQPEESVSFVGMPDGAFKTIAFPVAASRLRAVRDYLRKVVTHFKLSYPVSAEARLLFQAVNYLEGKAPDRAASDGDIFFRSLFETGIAPEGMPVKETARDGSSAWTLRRHVYVLFLGVPFTGLSDFLSKTAAAGAPIRHENDPPLPIELRPIIIPSAFEIQHESVALWDKERTTRCVWQFIMPGKKPADLSLETFIQGESAAEERLRTAETISGEIANAFQMKTTASSSPEASGKRSP